MNLKKAIWLGSALLLLGAMAAVPGWVARAAGDEAEAIIREATRLADEEKFEQANKLLMDLAAKQPDHPDVYWKISQNYYDIGERIDIEKDKAKKLDMYVKAEEWAKKGYDKNPDLADNAFWMAVGMSQQAQTKGVAATLLSDRTLAKRIEEYYIKSAEAKEFHYKEKNSDTIASAHFALGQFYRKIPDSFFVGLLMGTRGDMDKSVEHAREAVKMYPANVEYNKELGVSLLCRGQRKDQSADVEEARKYLNKVLELPADDALDKIDQTDARRLLDDNSLACGYSRVQQEEVSEGDLKEQ